MPKPKSSVEIKVVPRGNSRGVRLPKSVLAKYSIGESVVLEEHEDWSDLDVTVADGLD